MLYITSYNRKFNTRQAEKAYQHTLAQALLSHALKAEFNLLLSQLTIAKAEHGKPFFTNSNVKFSLSHCNGLVCCAVSTNEIGIDCERIRPFNQRLARRICTESELAALTTEHDRDFALTALWSLKESRTKLSGEGIGFGMKNAAFIKSGGTFISAEKNITAAVFDEISGFVVTACTVGEALTAPIIIETAQLL